MTLFAVHKDNLRQVKLVARRLLKKGKAEVKAKHFINCLKTESKVMDYMQCLLFRQQMEDKFVNHDYDSIMKQIKTFNVLKEAILRCAIDKSGDKVIDLRILLELVNNILTMERIQKIDPTSMA